jgi:NAD(P)-dependent dehydrogenase (short-subunit alcohol dehydrogenase family)
MGHEVIGLGRAECDLADLASVADFTKRLRSLHENIDLLINNAAVAGRRGITADGFELAFAVNYLSHFLITRALLSSQTRVVNVSSEAHRSASSIAPRLGVGRTKSLTGWREYAFSKACQIAMTIELAGRGIDAYSVHPGVIATGLWRPLPQPFRWLVMRGMAPATAGALPVMRAALDQDLESGAYVSPTGILEPSTVASDRSAIARLREQSEAWVDRYLD